MNGNGRKGILFFKEISTPFDSYQVYINPCIKFTITMAMVGYYFIAVGILMFKFDIFVTVL